MRVVMMDVDGVLVDGRPADGAPWRHDLETDLGMTLETLQRDFFHPRWSAIVTGKRDLRPELAEVLETVAPHVDVDRLIDYWFENDSRIDQGVLAALADLRARDVRVLLATNQEHMRARYLMETMQLSAHVDGIAYSAALGHRKPSAAFYEAATAMAGAAPAEIVLVDDTLENIDAARTFGWRGVHWTKGTDPATLVALASGS